MADACRRQFPEETSDFTGYVLFDELDPGLHPNDIWDALDLDTSTVDEKRLVTYQKHLFPSKEMCAIVKFCDEENAQRVIERYRRRNTLKSFRGLNVSAALRALSDLEGALTGLVDDEDMFKTHVMVETSADADKARDFIISAMRPFGKILNVIVSDKSGPNVIASVWFKYYSSALASQVACHGRQIKEKTFFVALLRERDEVTEKLLDHVMALLEPEKSRLKSALLNLLNASF